MAIDPLQKILDRATQENILSPVHSRTVRIITSLYADDAAIFMNPIKDEIQAIQQILQVFGQATGLVTKLQKSAVYLIRSEELDLQDILQPFPGERLRKTHYIPLIEKPSARLPRWKGKLLSTAGRLTLMNSVLSSLPTYQSSHVQNGQRRKSTKLGDPSYGKEASKLVGGTV